MAISELKKSIGVWGLSFNLIKLMIGAGIFIVPAIVAAGLGIFRIPGAYLVALIIAALSALHLLVSKRIKEKGLESEQMNR